MNIEKIMPTIMGVLIIVLLALATSCSSNKLLSRAQYYDNCPAYH